MILVINVGLKNARCILFDSKGNEKFNYSKPIKTSLKNKFVEQSVKEIENKTISILKKIPKRYSRNITYITVTTSACCLVCLDSSGKPLTNSIIVSDTRSVEQCKKINKFLKTNNNNNIQCRPDLMLPKILWIKENKRKIYNKTFKFLNIGDFLSYKITQKIFTDSYNASKFILTKNKKIYNYKLYKYFGLEISKLPTISDNKIFNLCPNFKKQFKINNSCKFVQTSYDAIASMLGCGSKYSGDLGDMSGTVSNMRILCSKKPKGKNKNLYSFNHPFEKKYIIGGSNNLGGGIIEWLKNVFYLEKNFNYKDLDKIKAKDFHSLIFLPYLMGERAPIWDEKLRGVLFGLSKSHGKDELMMGIFSGMGYSLKFMIEEIEKFTKLKVKKIFVSGGLSRINNINQIKSDITNKKVIQLNNYETTSVGAAIWVEKVVTKISLNKLQKKYLKIKKIYNPNFGQNQRYMESYKIFKKLNLILKDVQHLNYKNNLYFKNKKKVLLNL